MLKRGKKAQFEIGFSMIFSIIVIIAIIGVAFYVITFFLDLNECGQIGNFYNNLDKEVDKAWKSTIYSDDFAEELPSGIEQVCFGNLSSADIEQEDREEAETLSKYRRQEKNVFLYPIQDSCDSGLGNHNLEHVEINGFWCAEVISGEITVSLEKGSRDALVKLEQSN